MSSPVRKAFKMIVALPFVEPGSVVEFWDVLEANCPSDMDAFCDYFEYTWIGNSTRAPVFEKFLWNQYDTVLANLPRSNKLNYGITPIVSFVKQHQAYSASVKKCDLHTI